MRFQDPTVLGWLALLLLPIALWRYRRSAPRRIFTAPWFYFQDATALKKSSHWQKWIQNLLFWIACATIALLVLVLAKPQWTNPWVLDQADEMVLIVDTSVSMASMDPQEKLTSLARAKRLAEQVVRNASPNTSISLMTLNANAKLLTDSSATRESLVHALRELTVEGVVTDASNRHKALERALANLPKSSAVRFITDRIPEPQSVSVSDFQVLSVAPTNGANLGITKVEILRQPLRSKTSAIQFAVSGSASNKAISLKGKVQLYLDGRGVWVRSVDVNSNEEQTFQATFDLSRAKHLKLVLVPDFPDALAQDNGVEVSLPPLKTLKIGWVSDAPERHLDVALKAIADTGTFQVVKYRTATVNWKDPVDAWLIENDVEVPELQKPIWFYGTQGSPSVTGLKSMADTASLSKKISALALESWGFESSSVTGAWRRVTPTLDSMYVAQSGAGHRFFLSAMHPTAYPRWLQEVSYPLWVSSVVEWLLEPSMTNQIPMPITSGWSFQRSASGGISGWSFQPWKESEPMAVLSQEETLLDYQQTPSKLRSNSFYPIGLVSLLIGCAILLWLLETFWIAKHER